MIESTQPLDLSLYSLETGLAELIEYRQSRLMDGETPPTEEEIAAIDAEIQRYEIAKPAKVTGVVGIFQSWKSKRQAAKAEIDRLRAIITHLETMEARLKDYCASVLERLPAPKRGSRKLVGVDGSELSLRTNGGLQPLEITDVAEIPDEYCRMEGWISTVDWLRILRILDEWPKAEMKRVPNNAAIREALAQPCPVCQGGSAFGFREIPCTTCGGTGKVGIPGARLLPRGDHVEVR